MPRSVNVVAARNRRRKMMKLAKGYFGRRKNVWTVAKNAVEKGLQYAYRDRRNKKREFRKLWITRINAACRQEGISYSKFMFALKQAGVDINRKVLADLAMNHPDAFKSIVSEVKSHVREKPPLAEAVATVSYFKPAASVISESDTPAPAPAAEPTVVETVTETVEVVTETVVENVPEPVVEAAPEPEPVAETTPEPTPEPEPVVESAPEPTPEPEVDEANSSLGLVSEQITETVVTETIVTETIVEQVVADDLTKIEGIGPKIAEKLNEAGIYTWAKLGATETSKIQEILDNAGSRYTVHNPGTWAKQAQMAANGEWDELNKWQDYLEGGVDPADKANAGAAEETETVAVPDDLKKIEGVGPKIEEHLNAAGIVNWKQLAGTEVDKLKEILAAAGPRYAIHDPGTWPRQAQLAVDGKWEELEKWQDELDGGKEVS